MVRPSQLLLSALAAGCLPSTSVDPQLAATEIGVAAVFENDRPAIAFLLTSTSAIPLSFGEETTLFLWKLSSEDFVREDGSHPSIDEMMQLRLRFRGEPATPDAGSCGRCLSPWGTPPQPIFPGDSCEP